MLKYIVAMLLTGARKRKVLDTRWSDFDLENRLWRIEFNKTGKPRYVPLSDGALQLLASLPRIEGCEYAFATPNTGKPFVSFFYSWDTARKRAWPMCASMTCATALPAS
jgi:integrase